MNIRRKNANTIKQIQYGDICYVMLNNIENELNVIS